MDYATSVPTENVQYSMNLERVLGESLQHYGIKRNVPFTNRSGSSMNVNFEVTDTKRAILSVHNDCGNGSMIVFTPDGKNVNDKNCIEQVKQIMANTSGFDTVYDRGAYVLDVDVNDGVYVNNERQQSEHNSGISCLVIRKENWERALSQAQQDHERLHRNQRDVNGENQYTHEQIQVKCHQSLTSPRKRSVSPMKPHIVLSVLGVKFASKPRALTENTPNSWENAERIPVIEFEYAFATDTPGDPNRKFSMMVATD